MGLEKVIQEATKAFDKGVAPFIIELALHNEGLTTKRVDTIMRWAKRISKRKHVDQPI